MRFNLNFRQSENPFLFMGSRFDKYDQPTYDVAHIYKICIPQFYDNMGRPSY